MVGLLAVAICAEAVPVTDAPADHSLRATDPPALGEGAIDDWIGDELISNRMRHLIDRVHADGAHQPYHRRAPSWIQAVADLQSHDAIRQAEDAARAERDRQAVAWLLEDEERRAAASSPQAIAEAAAADDPLRPWRRALGVVALFAALVGLGVAWLVRRPRRRQGKPTVSPVHSTDDGESRSRHRRRRSHGARADSAASRTARPPRRHDGDGARA